MESQTHASKQAPREVQSWSVQGNLLPTLCQPFASPLPTLRQPSPTLRQPFLPTPLQAPLSWGRGTRLETRVNGFLESRKQESSSIMSKLQMGENARFKKRHGCVEMRTLKLPRGPQDRKPNLAHFLRATNRGVFFIEDCFFGNNSMCLMCTKENF